MGSHGERSGYYKYEGWRHRANERRQQAVTSRQHLTNNNNKKMITQTTNDNKQTKKKTRQNDNDNDIIPENSSLILKHETRRNRNKGTETVMPHHSAEFCILYPPGRCYRCSYRFPPESPRLLARGPARKRRLPSAPPWQTIDRRLASEDQGEGAPSLPILLAVPGVLRKACPDWAPGL